MPYKIERNDRDGTLLLLESANSTKILCQFVYVTPAVAKQIEAIPEWEAALQCVRDHAYSEPGVCVSKCRMALAAAGVEALPPKEEPLCPECNEPLRSGDQMVDGRKRLIHQRCHTWPDETPKKKSPRTREDVAAHPLPGDLFEAVYPNDETEFEGPAMTRVICAVEGIVVCKTYSGGVNTYPIKAWKERISNASSFRLWHEGSQP